MPNSFTLAQKYDAVLSDVYKYGSASAILDTPAEKVKWTGVNTVNVYTTTVEGMIDYSRNNGYGTAGSVTGAWVPYTLEQDRGTEMNIDAMDNEEEMDMAVISATSAFVKREVVPETDAYTFAKIAGLAGTKLAQAVGNIIDDIDDAIVALDNKEVTREGRILFVDPDNYKLIKAGCTRTIMNGEDNIEKEVEMYSGMRVVVVPTNRFRTTVTLNDGSSARGFVPGAKKIHFMIVDPDAIIKVIKHNPSKLFTPAENQDADAFKYQYRQYYDVFVKSTMVDGVYVHCDS